MVRKSQTLSVYVAGPLPLACPAAEQVAHESQKGAVVRCNVEHSSLPTVGHGHTLGAYCCQVSGINAANKPIGYQNCPSWRKMRDLEIQDRELAKLLDRELVADAAVEV